LMLLAPVTPKVPGTSKVVIVPLGSRTNP
jgi:hypothetical protein